MKHFLVFGIAIMITSFSFAQAYEGTIEYDKKVQQALVIEYDFPKEALENAFMQKMENLGNKGKVEKGLFNKDKGFHVYKNVFISDISPNSMDYMYKVEQKSRKEKDEAVLYLIIYNSGNNAMEKFTVYDIDQAKSFLNKLAPDVEAADLELQIEAQEEVVAKAEKKFRGLQSDKEDMENKIKKLENDIQKNIKDQEDTQKDIENQQQALENLRLKRKPAEKTL